MDTNERPAMTRILPWEDDDWNWSVKTKIGDLSVVRDDESGEWLAKWVYFDDDDTIGRFANAELAMDACEADYIARCTEFLKLAGPGECVVDVKHLEFARVWFRVFRKTRIDWTIEADHDADRAFAAAIDAAKENHDAR